MEYKIALIPGDGIGPEIVSEAKKVLDKVCEKYHHTFTYSEVLLGGASIDVTVSRSQMRQLPLQKLQNAVLMAPSEVTQRHLHGTNWNHPNVRRQDFLRFVRH